MKKKLLELIVCPVCKNKLTLKTFKENREEIEAGVLLCSCGQFFPIIKNIPRILIGSLRVVVYERFPDFFKEYKNLLPQEKISKEIKGEDLKKKKTSESFGYEWEKFPEMIKEWEKNFKLYFAPLPKLDLLEGKTILDAGCGKGRHIFYAAKIAKEVIAVDLGTAIDVALYNNRNTENVYFIQADIYNLPFRANSFDFIFSLGVLHHLPTPEEGFSKLVGLLKNGAGILIYVYHNFSNGTFNFYLSALMNFFRRITIKIPHELLYVLCYPITILSYCTFVLPYRVFSKKDKSNWPLMAYANYPFRVLLNDIFDSFSAPIENRYSKEEITDWYQRANLKNIKILENGGWHVFGTK
ncbi:methyltransferase domain-containing protein [Patescibacteria group bacterium]|nr:methyltransferase domain-containing protein [Patescibacteria group bacterium]MBU4274589.1 methyltransferase domain-containing protein [Patescibacteria group bacterium]MBU4367263.1 methyltransferase domain-containing protein [Patescibacteria group bacterium]MBU4461508.1 methyltransferase domain-containing protein [Patescibacteria group bacterium]MCG2699954.1 methyltransferase domain-containing protein [Candidatus Parcubacteria bacterium]